jgi:hypothetical protein
MRISSQRKQDASATAGTVGQCVAREPVSLLREIFGPAILVISGQGRRMYQSLAPKPEGTIFSKSGRGNLIPLDSLVNLGQNDA